MPSSRREFDNWLKAYLDANKSSETPFEMLYWCGISALAGALQRKVWLDQGRYTLYPNFFIILVADAGVIQKSTTINSAMGLLRKVPTVAFAPDASTWEGFIKYMEDSHQADGEFTIESVNTKTSAVTICASELSTFLDPTNKYMLSALTKLWDCEDTFIKLTKFSGEEHIEKPCLNLIGGTTPAWMRDSFDRWSREGGFVSRTVFIFADKKRQLVAFPKKKDARIEERLVNDLNLITTLKGEFVVDPKVYELGEIWYKEHNDKVGKPGYVDSSGFKDRKQTHILKLAMVLAISRGDELRITVEDWAEALVQIDSAEKDFPKAFATLSERVELRPYYELLAVIQREKECEKTKLLGRFAAKYLLREMQQAMQAMIEAQQVGVVSRADGKTYYTWKGEIPNA